MGGDNLDIQAGERTGDPLAGVVVLWNVFGAAVFESIEETSAARRVLETIEDRLGEVLAVLVLVAAVAIWRTGVFKSDKSTGEKNS